MLCVEIILGSFATNVNSLVIGSFLCLNRKKGHGGKLHRILRHYEKGIKNITAVFPKR